MKKNFTAAALALALCAVQPVTGFAQTAGCDPMIAQAQDTARLNTISGRSILAGQTFSQRPTSFAQMTCLEKLFSFGNQSMDILFQPPSMSSLLGMIQNFVCQAATQYISQSMNGFNSQLGRSFNIGGLTSGGAVGQIIPGVNIGSYMGGGINGLVMQGSNTFSTVPLQPMSLYPVYAPAPALPTQQGSTIGSLYGGYR